MTPTTAPVEDRLLRASARLTRWASRHADLEVPLAQARLLSLLEDMQPARIGDLATADQTSQPSMSAQIAKAEASGWATRVGDPDDSRASLVSLTPEGQRAIDRARQARSEALGPVLEGLDEAALQRLEEAVNVLEDVVTRTSSPAVPAHA